MGRVDDKSLTKQERRYKLTLAEALKAAAEIITSGRDVEMRAVNGGEYVIVYELKKNKVRRKAGQEESCR